MGHVRVFGADVFELERIFGEPEQEVLSIGVVDELPIVSRQRIAGLALAPPCSPRCARFLTEDERPLRVFRQPVGA